MDTLLIEGGSPLCGKVRVHGSKNAVLPVLAGSILCGGESTVLSCPDLSDVRNTASILTHLGCKTRYSDGALTVDSSTIRDSQIPEELGSALRSSIVFLGALTATMGRAQMCFPGGCSLGVRPIDLHIKALGDLGIEIKEDDGVIAARAMNLHGANIHLSFPSVGATENVMLAAVKIKGETVITNAAREPEIVDLAQYLNAMGAQIRGAGSETIRIDGVPSLRAVTHTLIPDRIVASTYLCAALAAGGEIELENVRREHMSAMLSILEDCGAKSEHFLDRLYFEAPARPKAVNIIRTQVYPGFPTDAQSLIMAALTRAQGTSVIIENIFESRYKIIPYLCRMGADVVSEGRVAVIRGVDSLRGAHLEAPDLRGGAALMIAAAAAHGVSEVRGIEHIERGYENIEGAFRDLGVKIQRKKGTQRDDSPKEKRCAAQGAKEE